MFESKMETENPDDNDEKDGRAAGPAEGSREQPKRKKKGKAQAADDVEGSGNGEGKKKGRKGEKGGKGKKKQQKGEEAQKTDDATTAPENPGEASTASTDKPSASGETPAPMNPAESSGMSKDLTFGGTTDVAESARSKDGAAPDGSASVMTNSPPEKASTEASIAGKPPLIQTGAGSAPLTTSARAAESAMNMDEPSPPAGTVPPELQLSFNLPSPMATRGGEWPPSPTQGATTPGPAIGDDNNAFPEMTGTPDFDIPADLESYTSPAVPGQSAFSLGSQLTQPDERDDQGLGRKHLRLDLASMGSPHRKRGRHAQQGGNMEVDNGRAIAFCGRFVDLLSFSPETSSKPKEKGKEKSTAEDVDPFDPLATKLGQLFRNRGSLEDLPQPGKRSSKKAHGGKKA